MQLLTVVEAAGLLRVSEETVRRYLRAGQLHAARRVGRRWLIPDSTIAGLVDSSLNNSSSSISGLTILPSSGLDVSNLKNLNLANSSLSET